MVCITDGLIGAKIWQVQELWWEWAWILRSVSWNRRIQVYNGIPLHEER